MPKSTKKTSGDYSEAQKRIPVVQKAENIQPTLPKEESVEEFYDEQPSYDEVEEIAPSKVDSVELPAEILAKVNLAEKDLRVFLRFNRRGDEFDLYDVTFLPAEKVDKEGKVVKATPMFTAMNVVGRRAYPAKGVVFQALKTGMENEAKRLNKSVKDLFFHVTYVGEQESNQKIQGRKGIFKSFVVKGY